MALSVAEHRAGKISSNHLVFGGLKRKVSLWVSCCCNCWRCNAVGLVLFAGVALPPPSRDPLHEGPVRRLERVRLHHGEVEEDGRGAGVPHLHEERHRRQQAAGVQGAGGDLKRHGASFVEEFQSKS